MSGKGKSVLAAAVLAAALAAAAFFLLNPARERLPECLENVDESDRTPAVITYLFRPGQRISFDLEVARASNDTAAPAGAILQAKASLVLDVLSADGPGANLEGGFTHVTLESAGGYGRRRVEIAPSGVRVFDADRQTEPAPEDIEVHKLLTGRFNITVSPRGEVRSPRLVEAQGLQPDWLQQLAGAFFLVFPPDPIVPGDAWENMLPVPGANGGEARLENKFLGYKSVEGERCAAISFNMIYEGPLLDAGRETAQRRVNGRTELTGGMLFSFDRRLPVEIVKQCHTRLTDEHGQTLAQIQENGRVRLVGVRAK